MAVIGQALTSPEPGWKRYDDTHPAIKYGDSYSNTNSTSSTGGSYVQNNNLSAKFRFIGKNLRIIAIMSSSRTNPISITIDGVTETFSEYSETVISQALVYEKANLNDGEHFVEILGGGTATSLDAIDIDSTGRLLHLDEILSPDELSIGKRIRCHYQATANAVGTFSGLGEETSDFIPPGSSNVPNGDFYWIACKDENDKVILLADRNIQSNISYDTINSEGMTSTGREINF